MSSCVSVRTEREVEASRVRRRSTSGRCCPCCLIIPHWPGVPLQPACCIRYAVAACCCCSRGSAPTNPNRCCCVSGSRGIIASTPCRCHSRVLVAHLVVHVLAHLLKDGRADFRKLDLSELRLGERACTRVPGCHIKPLTTLGCLHRASCITLGAEHVPDRV